MISNYQKRYCCEDMSLIENYDKAIKDETQVWDCHHRKETDENLTRSQLIKMGLYYKRPANELIYITHADHIALHHIGKKRPIEVVMKVAESNRGQKRTPEQIRNISQAHLGIEPPNKGVYGVFHHTEESRDKISKSLTGRKLSEEHKAKLRKPKSESANANMRKPKSEEHIAKLSKIVLQFTKNCVFVAKYKSVRDVCRQCGFNHSSISQCCNGKIKQAYGFIWRYKDTTPTTLQVR